MGIHWGSLEHGGGSEGEGGSGKRTACRCDFYYDFSFSWNGNGTGHFNEGFADLDDLEGILGTHSVTKLLFTVRENR